MKTRRPIFAPGMDLDAGQEAGDVRDEAGQPMPAARPTPGRPAMHHQRMQARVTGQHLPAAASGGIPFEDAGNVFPDALEHGDARSEGDPV
jgi:hypothetical protein